MLDFKTIDILLERDGKETKDLAAYIGVSPSVVSDWKSGRLKPPSIEKVVKIALFFNTTVDSLLLKSTFALPQGEAIKHKNEKEHPKMSDLKFFENPPALVLKALRCEVGFGANLEGFFAELNSTFNGTAWQSSFSVKSYEPFEALDYTYDDLIHGVTNDIYDYHGHWTMPNGLHQGLAKKIAIYYNKTLKIENVFAKKIYSNLEVSQPSTFAAGITRGRLRAGFDEKKLAASIGVEEISVTSWVTGEREVNDRCKQKLCNILHINESGELLDFFASHTPEESGGIAE